MNTFGSFFTLTTAGESHGQEMIGIIDGMPAGIKIDFDKIKLELSRRRPGQKLTTKRYEEDEVTFLSGILNGVTLGTPIAFSVKNKDCNTSDYEHLKASFRPSHADYTYQVKYGIRDIRGGGRASARETVLRVVGGALALHALKKRNIEIDAYTSRIGKVALNSGSPVDLQKIWESGIGCPDQETSEKMIAELEYIRLNGDTVGCEISCIVSGLPAGVGEPIYDKLSARLGYAMLSINAAHSFEYGDGSVMGASLGSDMVDKFIMNSDGTVGTLTNHSGGIQGGISNGMPIKFKVSFKPLPTLMQTVQSINYKGDNMKIEPHGRHDVCASPRVVPVVRAMAAMTILDLLLQHESRRHF